MISKTTMVLGVMLLSVIMTTSAEANNGVPTSIGDLEASFAGFEVFLTTLNDDAITMIADIINLQGNQTSILASIAVLEAAEVPVQDTILRFNGPSGINYNTDTYFGYGSGGSGAYIGQLSNVASTAQISGVNGTITSFEYGIGQLPVIQSSQYINATVWINGSPSSITCGFNIDNALECSSTPSVLILPDDVINVVHGSTSSTNGVGYTAAIVTITP